MLRCGRKTRATKKYSIRSAPNILVIHLKRFDSTHAGKLSHYVAYPEMLTLPESLTGNNVQYRLYGVLVHLGYTSHSGHYYAYVRAPNGQQWVKADDSYVSPVSASDALSQNAYILFYTRVSPASANTEAATSPKTPTTPPTTTTTTTNSTSIPNSSLKSTQNPTTMHLPRSILLNGNGKNPINSNGTNNHIPNKETNGIGLKNESSSSSSSASSSTSNYLNGIFVGKRPSSSPGFVPRVSLKSFVEFNA